MQRWLDAGEDEIQWNQRVFAYLLSITKQLNDEGITLLVGSDAGTMYMPPGLSTHDEIDLLSAAGLDAETILRAATINAAETLEIGDRLGTVEQRKVADLVILSENPFLNLKTLRSPVAVVKNGQWIDQTDIELLLESGKNPSSFYISMGRLLEDLLKRKFE